MVIENQSLPGVTREVEWLELGLVGWFLKNQSFPGVTREAEWLGYGLVEWLLKTNHSLE